VIVSCRSSCRKLVSWYPANHFRRRARESWPAWRPWRMGQVMRSADARAHWNSFARSLPPDVVVHDHGLD
jgi:hypothetical protein